MIESSHVSMDEGVLLADEQGRVVYANSSFEVVSGVSIEQLKSARIPFMAGLPLEDEVQQDIFRQLRQGHDFQCDFFIEGRSCWQYIGFYSVRNENGQVSNFIRTQKSLRDRLEKIQYGEWNRAILKHASDGIHLLDESGYLVEVSDQFCEMLGYSRDELLYKHLTYWDPEIDILRFQEFVKDAFQKINQYSQTSSIEARHRRKDGEFMDVEIRYRPIHIKGENLIFASARDIGERNQLMTRLEVQAEHLRKANKKLEHLANTDPLTSLPNRLALESHLCEVEARMRRFGKWYAIVMLDLDGFKPINDQYGHETGDLLLKELAQRFRNQMREIDYIARIGAMSSF